MPEGSSEPCLTAHILRVSVSARSTRLVWQYSSVTGLVSRFRSCYEVVSSTGSSCWARCLTLIQTIRSCFVFLSAHNEKRPKNKPNAFVTHEVDTFFSVYPLHLILNLILCFRASQYKSIETPTWCNTVQVLFLQSQSTCFGRKRPSSGVFKTITTATGTYVIVAGKSSHLLIRAGTEC